MGKSIQNYGMHVRSKPLIVIVLAILFVLWELIGQPLWNLNVERVAEHQEIDEVLRDALPTLSEGTMSDSAVEWIDYLTGPFFTGFVLGALIFGFWDWVDRKRRALFSFVKRQLALSKGTSNVSVASQPIEAVPSTTVTQEPELDHDDCPVSWDFENAGAIFGFNDSHDGQLLVSWFRILGDNILDEPLWGVRAFITPHLIGEPQEMCFLLRLEPVKPEDTHGVPVGAELSLGVKIPASDPRNPQGIIVDEYLEKFGGFHFRFEYNGSRVFEKDVTFQDVEKMLIEQRELDMEKKKRRPEIRKRD